MKKPLSVKIVLLLALTGAALISAVFFLPRFIIPNQAETEMLKKYGLEGLSVKEMVNKLDSITDEKSSLNASITGTDLILYDNGKEYDFALPKDEFYVSFAPYIHEVHPCKTHNLVSCRGELFNQEFDVSIVKSDGTVLMDQKVKSMESGFIGVWLPRDIEATLTVSTNGLSVTQPISTFADSDTCITTPLKLS